MGEDSTEVRAQVRDVERQAGSANTSSTTVAAGELSDHPDAPIDELEEDNSPPTPRFIQDEGAWKRWKWVPYSVRRPLQAAANWARGPATPRAFKIEPLLPQIQHVPIVLLTKVLPNRKHRILLLFFWLAMWLVTFAVVMRQALVVTDISGWGPAIKLGCGAAFWASDNGCGIDGNLCRPFTNGGMPFRCPASCSSYHVLNPRAVGDQELVYQSLVVGGPSDSGGDAVYRGDSFICGAAIHAGIISDTDGGCGVVKLIGTQRDFNGSTRNGIPSVGFDSYFPLSFTFESAQCEARDPKWSLLIVSVVFSTVLSLFTTSPAVFFFSVFTGVYWTVGMATDTPNYSSVASLFSRELGNYVPAMFAAWVMFDKMGVRRALDGLAAQIEKTVLWLGPCWVGALTNHTFDFIPIQRLTEHDLDQQPGARVALAIIIVILVLATVSQIWFFRQEGRLIRYLQYYVLLGIGLLICVALPYLKLRIHHYILALLLLPGTSMQTRFSLVYQGLLVGLFLNGIARWGWDPFLQTAYAIQGDQQLNSPLPEILSPMIELGKNISTITFAWAPPPLGPDDVTLDGISVLVNDVERFETYFEDDVDGKQQNFTWTREAGVEEKEYFRFAWLHGSESLDYTKAGTWNARGEWVQMAPGPSRIKMRRGAREL
ncbi:hypothetical protein QBC47DRAFT_367752 [Echria macrotheca]|uniref:LCCL domain-containing protein n=1 Tax=Echria macrotheca TaxID=438768 RepID=A0AAJ0BLT9_9PEZI|nr:hypothetical protein QBC47DRAFT_367752 [Echria macrotheca]